jgi:hypothetical protein
VWIDRLATRIETLVGDLGRPQDLARAVRVREQAAHHLGDWSQARYSAQAAQIDRLLERGELPAAQAGAQHLHAQCLAAGGDSQTNQHQLFTQVTQAIQQNTHNELAQQLTDQLKPDDPPWYTALSRQLQSILAGHRELTTTDHEVDPVNAAELQLLLETLSQHKPGKTQK